MKKTTLILNVLFILAISSLAWLQFRSNRIAYIDSIKLIQNYKGMKVAQAEMAKAENEMKARVDTLRNELENALKEFEKNQPKMSAKERSLSEQLLRNRQNQFLQYQQAIEQKINAKKQEITQNALAPVDDFIKQYGKKHKYKLILGATASGNIVYADKAVDITDKILEELNK